MRKREKDKNQLKEPTIAYGKKRIGVFTSFKEAEEDNYRYWLSLTPEQRIANVTTLIKRVYSKELLKQENDKRIHFDEQWTYFIQ